MYMIRKAPKLVDFAQKVLVNIPTFYQGLLDLSIDDLLADETCVRFNIIFLMKRFVRMETKLCCR